VERVARLIGPAAAKQLGIARSSVYRMLGTTLTEAQRAAVQEQIAAGANVSALAKRYGTSRQTIMRARDAALQ
jgi:putative DNA-invertase from lambdoid prophage Rac